VENILQKSPGTIFTVLNKEDHPTGIVERTQLESFLETGKTPHLQNPVFVYPNQTMQDIEPLLKEAPLCSLVLVSHNQRFLGLFTSSDAAQSQKNEDELANS
jgi:predicted transcriptional regulator